MSPWIIIGLALWGGSIWFSYSLGWLHGNTAGIHWSRVQIYDER